MSSARDSSTDIQGLLTFCSGVALLLSGLFASSIPFLASQGSLTRPMLILSGIACIVLAALPLFKKAGKPKKFGRY